MSKVCTFGRNGNTRTEAIRYTHKPRQIKTDLTETRSFIDEIREELKEEGPKSYLFISAVSIQKTKVVDDSETLRWQVGKSTTATYFRLDENNLKPPMTKGRDLAAIFHRLHPVLFKEAQDKRDKVMSKLEDGSEIDVGIASLNELLTNSTNRSLLQNCLIALILGKNEKNLSEGASFENDVYRKKICKAAFTASEILLYAKSRKPGIVQVH